MNCMPLALTTFWAPKSRCAALGRNFAQAPARVHSPLQALYNRAKQVFVEEVAAVAEQDVQDLKHLLGGLSLHLCSESDSKPLNKVAIQAGHEEHSKQEVQVLCPSSSWVWLRWGRILA